MATETVTTETTVATTTSHVVGEHKLLGESYAFWCQTLVLLAAAIFAYVQIRSSRAIERRKAAAEALFSSRRDKELTEARRYIAVLHASDKNMAAYAREDSNKDNPDALRNIRYALNHYEYVSVAISQGIYDETIFKNASYRTIVQLYNRTKPFIDAMRKKTQTDTTWQEFECLAVRWIAKPLKVKSIRAVETGGFWGRFFSS